MRKEDVVSRRRVYLVALTAEQHDAVVVTLREMAWAHEGSSTDGLLQRAADAIEHAPTVTATQVDGIGRAVRNLGEQLALDGRSDLRHVVRAASDAWAALHRTVTR